MIPTVFGVPKTCSFARQQGSVKFPRRRMATPTASPRPKTRTRVLQEGGLHHVTRKEDREHFNLAFAQWVLGFLGDRRPDRLPHH